MDAPLPVLQPVVLRRRRSGRRPVVVLLVLLVLAVAAWLAFQASRPAPPDLPARIAAVDPEGRLVAMDPEGTSLARFDVPGVAFQFPAWSPDGSRVAAIGGDGRIGAVYVFPADGDAGDATVVYESRDQRPFYLSWSPDSERVSFLANEPDGIALRIAPADGATPARIIRRGAPFYWDWIDDSRLLVHIGETGPNAFLGELDLQGAAIPDTAREPGFFRAPVATRSLGHRAWIERPDGAGQSIVLEARDGSGRHAIPAEGAVAIGFDPSGGTLAYIASDRPTAQPPPLPIGPLRSVDAASGAVTTLVDGPVMAFFWSPDGDTIAALEFVEPGGPDTNEAGLRSNHDRRTASLARPPAPPNPPEAAAEPPGLDVRLRFVDPATGETRSDRRIRVTNLFAFQVLPFFDQYALSHRFWSPDSRSLVLPVAEAGEPDRLVVVPADGAEPRTLADGSMASWSP